MLKRLRRLAHSYFTFTRSERTGVLVILIFTALVAIVPVLYNRLFPPKPTDWNSLISRLHIVMDSVESADAGKDYDYNYSYSKGHNMLFNPNTVTEDSLTALGLPAPVVRHWLHYRQKGGLFRYREDVLKVYGVEEDWFNKVRDYILLPGKDDTAYQWHLQKSKRQIKTKVIEFGPIELNTADTTLLMRLSGIGTKRAAAIVHYRNRLGGFYDKKQLREIRIVPDSVLEVIWNNISVNAKLITKFNINTTPMDYLQQHPYIGKKMGLIIDTRRHSIPIKDSADLLSVPGMDAHRLTKLMPYIDF